MSDDVVLPVPNLSISQYVFVLTTPSLAEHHASTRELLTAALEADEMAPYYNLLAPLKLGLKIDLPALEGKNKEQLDSLAALQASAEATEGETEISDALRNKANYLTRIGEREAAVAAQELALEKTSAIGARIDISLTLVRLGMFWGDEALVKTWLAKTEKLVDEGGDWDRRNRLKVYKGIQLVGVRDFKAAGELLLDAISTFTATELLSYNDFVALTVIAGTITLGRVELKKKIISSPEVTSVLPEIPLLGDFMKSLYEARYSDFFASLAKLEQSHLLRLRILHPHARYYVKEARVLAYQQVLESYRSLEITRLAQAFGVAPEWIDNDLANFIASGRISARIDRVNGVIETTRSDRRHAQMETVVKVGDAILSEVGKLGRGLY